MRYAVLRGDDIENLIEWDGVEKWSPPAGATVAVTQPEVFVDMRWKWNAGRPIDPKAEVKPEGLLERTLRFLSEG